MVYIASGSQSNGNLPSPRFPKENSEWNMVLHQETYSIEAFSAQLFLSVLQNTPGELFLSSGVSVWRLTVREFVININTASLMLEH